MTSKRIFLALTLAAVAVVSATALRAQSDDKSAHGEGLQAGGNKAHRLEGSWIMTVTAVSPPGRPTRTNYTTFARGGVSVGSDRLAPLSNPQHGVWEHLGGNEYAWTFISDGFDATGNYAVTLKVTSKITLTGPDTFVGVNSSELRNAAGNLLLSGCNTIQGQRIKIEPLAEHCQGIALPQ